MKLSKAEIRREIEKISSTYKTDELFSQDAFFEILQAVVTSACEPLNRVPRLLAQCNVGSDFTACTEGTEVRVNTLSPLVREVDTSWGKYVNCVGHIIHECGHVLFTDFVEYNKQVDGWQNEGDFVFYPNKPKVEGIDTDKIIEYLNTHPNYRKILVNEMLTLQNVVEDIYIENRCYEKFDGVATLGLANTNLELYRTSPLYNEILEHVVTGKIFPITAFHQTLLMLKAGQGLKRGIELSKEQQEVDDLINQYLEICEEELDLLKWESDGKIRCDLLNRILVKIMPLLPTPPDNEDAKDPSEEFKKMIEKIKNQLGNSKDQGEGGQSDSEQGSSNDYSSEQVTKSNANSNDMASKNGATVVPKGYSKPVDEEADQEKSSVNKKQAENACKDEDVCKHKYEDAVKQTATKQFEQKDEQNHQQELQKEADDIDSKSKSRGFYSGRKLKLVRPTYESTFVYDYENIYSEVQRCSKSLTRKMLSILKDREEESCDSGYIMGQRFNPKDVVHNDGKYFSKISVPDGKLRVCFGVLVDESGSMDGSKISKAKKATILLEDTLRNLNTPHIICGHTTGYEGIIINNYVDFDTNDNKDKYRLAQIKAEYGNVDGAAITYMGEKLLKRPEEQKVLIVISDGLPAGVSYYSANNSDEDTILAIKKYRKSGVNVFGAVIDDYEDVSKLYGEQYCLDCREDGALEKNLIRLIKKYLKNI